MRNETVMAEFELLYRCSDPPEILTQYLPNTNHMHHGLNKSAQNRVYKMCLYFRQKTLYIIVMVQGILCIFLL
jgi:hypothetical protein